MAKKRFTTNFEDIFTSQPESTNANSGKTKEANRNRRIKSTYLYEESTLEAIKAISYYKRMHISEVLDAACKAYINSFDELDKAMKLYTGKQSGN